MNARAHTWTRGLVAAGLALSLGSCGYIEDLIEDTATNSPGDISGFDETDAATYGKVATYLGLIDGITQDFGTSAASLAKGGALLTPRAGSLCAVEDFITFDPATYSSTLALDKVVIDFIFGATDGCVDSSGNDLTGSYTVTATGLDDEAWPATAAQFADFDAWTFTDATLLYEFNDMSAVVAGPITTMTNGKLSVDETPTSEHAVSVGSIKTELDDGTNVISAILSKIDLTKTLGASESTSGTLRIAVTLFGYLDVTVENVVVNVCPNAPDTGIVTMDGADGLSMSINFDTGDCATVDATKPDGTVVTDVTIGTVFS